MLMNAIRKVLPETTDPMVPAQAVVTVAKASRAANSGEPWNAEKQARRQRRQRRLGRVRHGGFVGWTVRTW